MAKHPEVTADTHRRYSDLLGMGEARAGVVIRFDCGATCSSSRGDKPEPWARRTSLGDDLASASAAEAVKRRPAGRTCAHVARSQRQSCNTCNRQTCGVAVCTQAPLPKAVLTTRDGALHRCDHL